MSAQPESLRSRSQQTLDAVPERSRRLRDGVLLCLIMLVGGALRLDLLVASGFSIDADEAIVGLMGLHIATGAPFPTFYYGQAYMGSLEPLCVAASFLLFGVSPVVLKLVPFAFALALIPVTYMLGRAVTTSAGALIGAWLVAVCPSAFIEWSTRARGGFIEVVVIGTLALYFTARWLQKDRPPLGMTVGIGALLGVGWWTNNQIIFTMVPIALFMTIHFVTRCDTWWCKLRALTLHGLFGLIGWLGGGLPYWEYNVRHSWPSLGMFRFTTAPLENAYGFLTASLPILLGARRFWQTDDIFPYATPIVASLFLALLCVYVRAHVRRFRRTRSPLVSSAGLLPVFLLTAASVFVLSSFGSLVTAPRYLLPIYPPLYLMVGIALCEVTRVSRIAGVWLLAVVTGVNLFSSYYGGRTVPGEPFVYDGERVERDHAPLISWLDREGYSWVKTNYWIGYKLAFETQERVRFLVTQIPDQVRIPEYEREGRTLPPVRVPYVLTKKQGDRIERGLRGIGYNLRRTEVGSYVVLDRLERVKPQGVPYRPLVLSSNVGGDPSAIIDGNLRTRWGSAKPQAPGMEIAIALSADTALRGISFTEGSWASDSARSLSIACLHAGAREVLVTPQLYDDIRYALEGAPFEARFDERRCDQVVLTQHGVDPIFDWSIAELMIYG